MPSREYYRLSSRIKRSSSSGALSGQRRARRRLSSRRCQLANWRSEASRARRALLARCDGGLGLLHQRLSELPTWSYYILASADTWFAVSVPDARLLSTQHTIRRGPRRVGANCEFELRMCDITLCRCAGRRVGGQLCGQAMQPGKLALACPARRILVDPSPGRTQR